MFSDKDDSNFFLPTKRSKRSAVKGQNTVGSSGCGEKVLDLYLFDLVERKRSKLVIISYLHRIYCFQFIKDFAWQFVMKTHALSFERVTDPAESARFRDELAFVPRIELCPSQCFFNSSNSYERQINSQICIVVEQ